MDFKKSKKYTESYKTEFLNKLNEGKMVDVQEGQNLKVAEVSKELPKNAKIEKDEKQSFEDYKTMYKDVITQKCIEDYGVDTDTKLWEDTAKELYLKSKTYIPTGEEKSEEVLVKKEESKSLKENKNPEDLTTIKEIEEYINNIQDKHTKNILHHILEDEKQQENPNVGYLTMAIRKVSEVENSREKKTENFNDSTKFLTHILNGVIKDIQDKFNVIATAEFDTNNTNSVVVTLKGNTLDLIDATSYLSKIIRNDNVDFNFDDTIKDNTVKCTISPKTKMESKVEKNKSIVKESYFVKLFNQYGTDVDTIDVNSEQEAIEVAEEKMREGWRAVVYNANNKEALYDYDPFEGLQENKLQLESRDRVAENLSKFIYDLTTEQDTEAYGETAWSGNQPTKMGNGVTVYEVYKNGKSNYTMDDIKKAVLEKFPELDVYGTSYSSIFFYKPQKTENKLQEDTTNLEYNYMLLDRLKQDCEYFLGNGNGNVDILWAKDIDEQIAKMKELYNSFTDDEKPEWITIEDIDNYEKKMKALKDSKEKKTEVTEKDLDNEDKKEETVVTDYTLSEIKKIIDSNGNDFTIKIVNSNEDVETKTLNIDREDLINIYNVLGGNKDSLQEDQYENERRRGKPSIKKIAETEFYDNQDWYIQHIKDYSDEEDFIKKEIAEIAEEYNLKENTAKQVCKEIYNLAIKN